MLVLHQRWVPTIPSMPQVNGVQGMVVEAHVYTPSDRGFIEEVVYYDPHAGGSITSPVHRFLAWEGPAEKVGERLLMTLGYIAILTKDAEIGTVAKWFNDSVAYISRAMEELRHAV